MCVALVCIIFVCVSVCVLSLHVLAIQVQSVCMSHLYVVNISLRAESLLICFICVCKME